MKSIEDNPYSETLQQTLRYIVYQLNRGLFGREVENDLMILQNASKVCSQ